MNKQNLMIAVSTGLISLGIAGRADAALVSRLGGLAYYNTAANLIWLVTAATQGAVMANKKLNTGR